MAVETKPAGSIAITRELLISGSEGRAEALTLADLDVGQRNPTALRTACRLSTRRSPTAIGGR